MVFQLRHVRQSGRFRCGEVTGGLPAPRRGPESLAWRSLARFAVGMFVSDEVLLDVSFAAAQARLANLARGGSLLSASQAAYDDGITGMGRVGPRGSAPGMSRLVQVHFRDLVIREGSAMLTLRWETVGPGGGLFPALDADITLTPAGDQASLLKLAGAHRPPLRALALALTGRSCTGWLQQRRAPS